MKWDTLPETSPLIFGQIPSVKPAPENSTGAAKDNPLVTAPAMNRQRLMDLHNKICGEAYKVLESRNRKYATDTDPFKNFRTFGRLGILVRISDKLARLNNFVENPANFADESVLDTCLDLINYAILFYAYE